MFFKQGANLCEYPEKRVEALDKTELRTQIPVMPEYWCDLIEGLTEKEAKMGRFNEERRHKS